ncbi:hypothetical protein HY768_00950 [candidate division TA06 bacterium]|uniref:Bacterial Ig-like domain-containing protein n=1 Tax=candidate division TA06 bacterium TaxID=2250710 RepID=A0A933I8S8_UNCT6|nr:hypothetical protein [candidate division TA06 bacterium]
MNYDIYAERINASGVTQWTVNGIPICTANQYQGFPQIVSDGSGGAIIAWQDNRSGTADIYVQRVNASGLTQWTSNGVAVCIATGDQWRITIVSDGSGGAIISWKDSRSGNYDIYCQRVQSSGMTQWTGDGVAICTAAYNQDYPMIVSDGSNGAIITWQDPRSGTNWDIYAQRVDSTGSTLEAPILSSPANGSFTNDNTPSFDWSDVTGATQYQIQIDNDTTFASPVKDTVVSVSNYTLGTSLSDGVYYWRVRAGDAANNWSDYTTRWSFTVDVAAPGIPILSSPADNSITNDNTPSFDWSDVTGATKYQIQIDDDSLFGSPAKDTVVSISKDTLGSPLADGVYYWRVRAGDAANNWSGYTNTWNFTVNTAGVEEEVGTIHELPPPSYPISFTQSIHKLDIV